MWLRTALITLLVMGLTSVWLGTQAPRAVYTLHGVIENSQGKTTVAAVQAAVGTARFVSQLTSDDGQFALELPQDGPLTMTVATTEGVHRFAVPAAGTKLVLRMPKPVRQRAAGENPPTVSVNDLQASARAQRDFVTGQKALGQSDLKRAWKFSNKAVREAPRWSRPYGLRGAIDVALHNYAAARTDLDTALARNPQNAEALTLRGRLAFLLEDNAAAERYLSRALAVAPVWWATYLDMANLDLRLHRYAETEQLAEKALACTPASPPAAYFLIAESHYYRHQYRRAQWKLEEYVAMLPDTPVNARGRAAALRNLHYLESHGLVH